MRRQAATPLVCTPDPVDWKNRTPVRNTEQAKMSDETRLTAERNCRSAAACRSADPELFFPISAFGQPLKQVAEAKAICACCPVRRQCLAFGLRTWQVHGIWGGMTAEEGDFIRRPRTRTG
jgi:WhiB family transcriptional regulator, redox-sensing transcriptional regulator